MLDEYEAAGQAIDALRRSVLAPTLLVESGNLLLQLGLYEDAAACFDAVPSSGPEATDAQLGLAAVHERCNRLVPAEANGKPEPGANNDWNADFSAEGLQARLRRASPVCLSARQRVQLLGEDRLAAEQTATACAAAP